MIELEERHAGRVLLSWFRRALERDDPPGPLIMVGDAAREIALGAVLQLLADDVDALVAPASWLELGELPEDPPKVLAVLIDLDTPEDLDDILAAWADVCCLLVASESLTPILPRSHVLLV